MESVVDGGEVHEGLLVCPQEKEWSSVAMVVLHEVANQLQNCHAFLSPSVDHILGLSRMNHREQVRARYYFANFVVAPIVVLVFVVRCLLLNLD